MDKQYSQKEIAEALNVSRATIDRVIHNRGDIGEETTNRVREYLNQINYKPNKVAKGLSKKLNKKIIFIYHVPENEFFSEIKRGIDSAINEFGDFGFSVEVIFSGRNSEKQIELIQQQLKNKADAIVLSPFEPDKFVAVINQAVSLGFPMITFNNDVSLSERMFYVGTDYYQSGRLAGEIISKISKKGKIAVLIGDGNEWQVSARLKGFKDVLQAIPSIQLIERRVNSLPHTEISYRAALDVIKEGVDAIFPLQVGIRGIVQAKREMKADHLDIIAYDLRKTTIENLEQGNITAIIDQDPFSQGYLPIKTLFEYFFNGKLPEKRSFITHLNVIFKENMEYFKKIRQETN